MSDDHRHLCAELARTAEAFGDGSKLSKDGLQAWCKDCHRSRLAVRRRAERAAARAGAAR